MASEHNEHPKNTGILGEFDEFVDDYPPYELEEMD